MLPAPTEVVGFSLVNSITLVLLRLQMRVGYRRPVLVSPD